MSSLGTEIQYLGSIWETSLLLVSAGLRMLSQKGSGFGRIIRRSEAYQNKERGVKGRKKVGAKTEECEEEQDK